VRIVLTRISLILLFVSIAGCSRGGKVLASVGSAEVTRAEYERKLTEVSPEYQSYLMTPAGRRQFFDILVREKLMLAAASDSPVVRSSDFRTEMDRFDAEQQQRQKEHREYVLTRMWIEQLRKDGVIASSDAEVDAYYQKHPKEVTVRHILLGGPEEAKVLVQQLRAGANFKALAKAKSMDAETAASGGEVQPFMYGELLPQLADVAFTMKVGETAGPVRSEFGYHIVRKESEKTLPKEQARDRIRRLLEKKKLDQHLEGLRPRYPVRILDPKFQ
jgi:peptidyl-prolyl cis-trans isomerase C